MSKRDDIRRKVLEILGRPEFKGGLQVSALVKRVVQETGENESNCWGTLYSMPVEMPEKIVRPRRGLFILKDNLPSLAGWESGAKKPDANTMKEEDIYEPAMQYLLSGQECTHAVVIGGKMFGKKWGTPDVLGAIRAESDAVYQPTLEIVAVEVKGEDYLPVEALGQAMAYKLFAHRTWLVLPDDSDLDRIKGIAIVANIGLISFATDEKGVFDFVTLNRPTAGHPDFTEINSLLNMLKEKDRKKYNELLKNETA